MSSQWPVKTLEEIQSSSGRAFAIGPFGSRMKSDTYVAKGVRVVRGTNIGDSRALKGDFVYITEELASQLESCRISPGDLFFPHRGSIGEVGIIDWDDEGRYILSSSLMKFACNLKLADPRFLYYYFRTAEGKNEILRFASTVGTPGIGQPLSSLRQMRVPAPPVELQSKITDVLCSLDDKIELNRRMNTTLESMAQAIFKSWFIDFDPVHRNAAKRQGQLTVANATSTFTLPTLNFDHLFPDFFEDSEIGNVPLGWQASRFSNLIEMNPARSLRKGTTAKYLDMKNVPTSGFRAMDIIDRAFSSGTKFMNGDTLLARITPCLENGKTAFVDFLEEDEVGWGSTEFIVLRPKVGIPSVFAYFIARDENFRKHAIQGMTGTSGRQRVAIECLDNYLIANPSAEVLSEFARITKAVFSQIQLLSTSSNSLMKSRDLLLPKLINRNYSEGQ